jgi:hypothetical protein
MFTETGEVSADDRARVSNPKSEAVLRARRDLGEPPSASRSDRPSLQASPPRGERATSGARCGSHRDKAREKDLERRRSAELAAAGHSTRPTDLQLFSAKAVMRYCLVDPSRIGCHHRDDMPEVKHRTSGQPGRGRSWRECGGCWSRCAAAFLLSSALGEELRPRLAVRCSRRLGGLPLLATLLHDALDVRDGRNPKQDRCGQCQSNGILHRNLPLGAGFR